MVSKFITSFSSLTVGITVNDRFRPVEFTTNTKKSPAYYLCREESVYVALKAHTDFGKDFNIDPKMDEFGKEKDPESDEVEITKGNGADNIPKDVQESAPSSEVSTEKGTSDERGGISDEASKEDNSDSEVNEDATQTDNQNTTDPTTTDEVAQEVQGGAVKNEGETEIVEGIESIPDAKQWLLDNKDVPKNKVPNPVAILNKCKELNVEFPAFIAKHSDG